MLFSSLSFLYYYFPCVVILYTLTPKAFKNAVLLLSSLAFYAWGEPQYVLIMLVSILFGYIFGILIQHFNEKKRLSKLFLCLSAITSLSALVYFKYADFFIENFSRATGISLNALNLVLPIGISFYTFQILSYTVDIYRGRCEAQKNPINLAVYITFFPQLIAGPIVRYSDIESQLTQRTHSIEKSNTGIKRFIAGLSKKVIFANTFGELCNLFNLSDDKSILFYWLFAFSYMLQIYFDFSGYSDMAIGLGNIFGFKLPENFHYPFCAKSITDFWRRWHISLGTWFRDYVYIPMGGSRCKSSKMFINIFTVWILTGLWHGAEWNFIVWGIYFAVLLCLEKFLFKKYIEKLKVLRHIYVIFFVTLSFVIFSAPSIREIFYHIKTMFGITELPFISPGFIYYLKSFGITLLLGGICSTPLLKIIKRKITSDSKEKIYVTVLENIIILMLLFICTAYLVDGSFNPFLYFRF
ncbi:MAG: MBOAT family protein [Clostridia bacterium]|nr:MBOAT family protein [Clostridia bacterium]